MYMYGIIITLEIIVKKTATYFLLKIFSCIIRQINKAYLLYISRNSILLAID